jgi:hypothetical protein
MKSFAVVLALCVATAAFGQAKVEAVKKAGETKVEAAKKEAEAKVEMKGTKLHGYVVDQMCAKGMAKKGNAMAKAAKHTKECALEEACASSGFGLFYDDGTWVKFDEKGDKLALAMFEKSKKGNDFMADVVGEVKDGKMTVASLTESTMTSEEMLKGKPAKKADEHDHK